MDSQLLLQEPELLVDKIVLPFHSLNQMVILEEVDYELEYLNSISAYYAKDLETAYLCCKKVILHHKDAAKIHQSIQNLQFYKMYLHRDKKMIHHLKDKTTPEFFAMLLKP